MSDPAIRGFTIIEALIAIALGTVIVGTAYAGFRVASSSVAATNRMSLENGLMRAGFMAALDEADFWTACDDPLDPARQKLRTYDAARNRGLPFTPFSTVGFAASRTPTTFLETERAFDPGPRLANDPRTWFHGNHAERIGDGSARIFGHYELFAHVKTAGSLGRVLGDSPAFGAIAPAHTWYMNQQTNLKNALGFYGLCDYSGANAIYGSYGDPGGDNRYDGTGDTDQGFAPEWGGSWSGGQFANGDGGTRMPRGVYRLTKDTSYLVVPATESNRDGGTVAALLPPNRLVELNHRNFTSGKNGGASDNDISRIYDLAFVNQAMLPIRPPNWPELSVGVMRYLTHNRFATLCKVRWTSPLTGELVEISFSTLSTSLRGARQQRRDPNDATRNLDGGEFFE